MKTPISYFGGKQTMLKHILPLIPPHTIYTESFCGGCAVLFAKSPAPAEVINDLNSEMVNFYEVAKIHPAELETLVSSTLHSRVQHARAILINNAPDTHTPLERAWAVWTLSKMCFASIIGSTFGYNRSGTTCKKIRNAKADFTTALCARLDHVTIENDDALAIIARYDCIGAFHFVDPPYIGTDCGHYEGVFDESNLIALLDLLSTIRGKFMLTMFPNELIEQAASRHGWIIHRVQRTISASKSIESRRKQEEWMVCNYTSCSQELALF